eukprot:scaffold98608_cov54-Phaeocystis_antarctica.AAC.1
MVEKVPDRRVAAEVNLLWWARWRRWRGDTSADENGPVLGSGCVCARARDRVHLLWLARRRRWRRGEGERREARVSQSTAAALTLRVEDPSASWILPVPPDRTRNNPHPGKGLPATTG